MTRRATVLVLLPGARSEYVQPEEMPFLAGLARRGVSGVLAAPPGLAHMAAIVTGRHPDTTGHFGTHVLDPRGSPFRWLRPFPYGRTLIRSRHPLFPVRRVLERVTRWVSGAAAPDPGWIPIRFLPRLRPLEGMRALDAPRGFGAPGLFDVARQRGMRHRVLLSRRRADDEAVVSGVVRSLRERAPVDLHVVRLAGIREVGEAHGPWSDALRRVVLREADEYLASLHAALAARHDAWDLVLCGEHGMAPVVRTVDLSAAIARGAARPGKDFVCTMNGTLAAFWCLTDRAEDTLPATLRGVPGAYLVDEAERRRSRIPAGRRGGDLLLAARPGSLFWRDHFHPPGPPGRGAFGYLDKHTEGDGVFVAASSDPDVSARSVGRRHLVDVFPTLCDLLAAPVPDGVEGASALDAPRGHAPSDPLTPYARVLPRVVVDA